MTVRAKFSVDTITKSPWSTQMTMSPVCSDDPNHENKRFWDATPAGSLQITVNNDSLKDFEPGQEYYLDFTLAPVEYIVAR